MAAQQDGNSGSPNRKRKRQSIASREQSPRGNNHRPSPPQQGWRPPKDAIGILGRTNAMDDKVKLTGDQPTTTNEWEKNREDQVGLAKRPYQGPEGTLDTNSEGQPHLKN